MVGNNIRYYRLMKRMSQAALAQAVGVGKMAISYYESGKRNPNYEISRKLSSALGISLSQLMAEGSAGITIQHGAFRKQSALSKSQQELIQHNVGRYLERLYEVVSFIGDSALPMVPEYEQIPADDNESDGQSLRHILGLSPSGPVGNVTDVLENRGFIICPIDFGERSFSGINGMVNGRPFIAVNVSMPAERQRVTLIHELAHLVFSFGDGQNEQHMVDGIAGAFLIPREDMLRELGPKRSDIRGDLRYIQREYGISMAAIVMRARRIGIITKVTYESTMKWMSSNGLRTDEQSDIIPEKTHFLEQLTSRAVAEGKIGISKAAELLEMPLTDVRRLWYGGV